MNKTGKLKINNAKLEKHELEALKILVKNGYNVEVIIASNQPGSRTPDILMDGVFWEIKSPQGKSKRTLENNLRKACEQSDSIIMDLRRIGINEDICLQELEKQQKLRKKIKRMLIIKKDKNLQKF